jgi:hypothetical protein
MGSRCDRDRQWGRSSTPPPAPTNLKKGAKLYADSATCEASKTKSINSFFDEYKVAVDKSGAQHERLRWESMTWRWRS